MQINTITCSVKVHTPSSEVEIIDKECKIELTSGEASYIYNANDKMISLLIRAINNRTRERNYFRKYCELLEQEITDEEFDREIEDHPDDYAISTDQIASREDMALALSISPRIMEVDSVEDLSDLFSFEHTSVMNLISAKP